MAAARAAAYLRRMKILAIAALVLLAGCSSEPTPPSDAGCDVPTSDDVNNCGACGIVCAADHASTDCDLGRCVVDQCEPGWQDCDRDAGNGCEVNGACQ